MARLIPLSSVPAVVAPVLDVEALAALAVEPTFAEGIVVDVSEYGWVDFAVALTDGGTPALAEVQLRAQWSNAASPGAGDWAYLTREEFETSGSGDATESTYTAIFAVVPGDLPTSVGIRCKCRGKWMRLLVAGDATTTDVDQVTSAYRRF